MRYVCGPAAGRRAQGSGKHIHDGSGNGQVVVHAELQDILCAHAARDQEQRHVTDDFAGGRDFHDVAEKLIDLAVGAFDFAPGMGQAHGRRLLAQVGVLAAGDFVLIDVGGAGVRAGIKRQVVSAHGLPVVGAVVKRGDVQAGVARRVAQRFDDGVQIGLAGAAAHGGDGGVGHVHAGVGGFEDGGGVQATGVVRVKVDGEGDFFAQRLDQCECGFRFANAGHIFDAQKMDAQLFKLLGQVEIIFEAVFRPGGIEQVAGVTDGGFADGANFEQGIDGDAHVVDGVEGIEHAEDVNSLGVGLAQKIGDDIGRIGSVADGVGAARQHLETDIGDALAELAQALPGILVEKAHGGVESGAAPHLQAEEAGQAAGDGLSRGQQVMGADARGQQGLMRVAESRVGELKSLLLAGPLREAARSELLQQLARAGRRRGAVGVGQRRQLEDFGRLAAFQLGVAVEDDVADVAKELGGAVAALRQAEKFRRFVEKGSGDQAVAETRVPDDVFEEQDVGLDAADAELAQGAIHAMAGAFERGVPGGDLHQQGVVIGRERRAGVGCAAVQTDAEAGRRAVGGQLAVVGREIIFGVFGGDAALDGRTVERDVALLGKRKRRRVQRMPLGDADLGLHQVDSGDHFGDGVLDLDARVDFDEVPAVGVGVEQKFERAGVAVAGLFRQSDGGGAKLLADRRRQVRRGGHLDHLLVTPLNGAVAFPEMQQVAVMIGQNLDFQVAGAGDVFFQEHGSVAEGRAGFVLRLFETAVEVGRLVHDAHAAAAAAHGRLDDHGIADVPGEFAGLGGGAHGRFRSGQNRDSRRSGQAASGRLIAQQFQQLRRRPDEGDAGLGAGASEDGILREEAVTGMDGVHLLLAGE